MDSTLRMHLSPTSKLGYLSFNFTYRYIDGVFSLNNYKFSDYVYDIYPVEFEIKETADDQYHSSF